MVGGSSSRSSDTNLLSLDKSAVTESDQQYNKVRKYVPIQILVNNFVYRHFPPFLIPIVPLRALAFAAPIPPPVSSPPPIRICWFMVACSSSSQAKFLFLCSLALLSLFSLSRRRSFSMKAASRRNSRVAALCSRLYSRRFWSRMACR